MCQEDCHKPFYNKKDQKKTKYSRQTYCCLSSPRPNSLNGINMESKEIDTKTTCRESAVQQTIFPRQYNHCERLTLNHDGVTCNFNQRLEETDQEISQASTDSNHANKNQRQHKDDVVDYFLKNYCARQLNILLCFWRSENKKIMIFMHWKLLLLLILFSNISTSLALPMRWEIGQYGKCSVFCGRGTQSRSVVCKNMPGITQSLGSHVRLPDIMCPAPKPITIRSCSLVECAPEWSPRLWSRCSRTCGRGIQKRQMACVQKSATGAIKSIPDVYCSKDRPSLKKKCGLVDCPSRYTTRKWSQCSVSCGKGIQLREVICSRVAAGEHTSSPISISHCSHLVTPVSQRSCKPSKCLGVGTTSRRMAPREPRIVTVRRNYVQTQKMPRIRLIVGMNAHVLRGTTVTMRCPVVRYRKSLIYWKMNENEIFPYDDDVSILPDSSLRIRSVGDEHVGRYTCVAGESEADLTLKIARGDDDIPLNIAQQDQFKMLHSHNIRHERRIEYTGHRPHQGADLEKRRRGAERPILISASSGYIEHIRPVHHRAPREHDYELRSPTPLGIISNSGPWKETSFTPEREFDDFSETFFSEVISNGERASVLAENKKVSILQPPRDLTFTDRQNIIKLQPGDPEGYRGSDHYAVFDVRRFSAPQILTQPTESPMQAAGDIVTYVGGDLIVAEPETVTLLCETSGYPTPSLEWFKDGQEIIVDERHIVLPDHSLRMLQPVLTDSGVYTCNATNKIGTDLVSTSLSVATKPRIVSISKDVLDIESAVVNVQIGSIIKARLGSTVIINCGVSGFPEPHVLWNKDVVGLGKNTRILPDNSLEIEPTTAADQGTYSCEANNPAGTDYQASVLVLLEKPHITESADDISDLKYTEMNDDLPQLFLTSNENAPHIIKIGTNVILGCPVTGFPEPKLHWTFEGIPVDGFTQIETVLDGKALVLTSFDRDFTGIYSCHAINEAGILATSLEIIPTEYSYILGNMTTCTETCGGNGTQYSKPVCVADGVKPVDEWYCNDVKKIQIQTVACNRIDCPPRFNTGAWSTCSKTCGIGEKSRKVVCTVLRSNNTTDQVSITSCIENEENEKPSNKETCILRACPTWKVGSWSQCGHKCYGLGTSLRARRLYCVDANGTKVSRFECKQSIRPRRKELCSTNKCEPTWISGRWSSCSQTCGNDGIKTRILNCVFRGNKWQRAGTLCSKESRPPVTTTCNRIKCPNEPQIPLPLSSKDNCEDKFRYCSVAYSSGMCGFYRHLCCKTCG